MAETVARDALVADVRVKVVVMVGLRVFVVGLELMVTDDDVAKGLWILAVDSFVVYMAEEASLVIQKTAMVGYESADFAMC